MQIIATKNLVYDRQTDDLLETKNLGQEPPAAAAHNNNYRVSLNEQ